MSKKNFVSIKIKLVALVSTSAFLAIILSSLALFSYTFFTAKDEVIRGLSQLTTVIGQNLVAPLEFDDKDAANLMLNALKDQENIKGAYIFKDIELFTSYIKKKQSKNLISETILFVYGKNDKKNFIKYIDANDIVTSFPIYSGGEFLGTFCLVSDTSNIKNAIANQAWVGLIVVLVVIFIIIILALSLQRRFTRQVVTLSEEMQAFSEDKTQVSALNTSDTNDEFTSIFEGFNLMMQEIRSQEERLDESHEKIVKSVKYASLVQKTILPSDLDLNLYFKEHFSLLRSAQNSSNKVNLFDRLRLDKDECLMVLIDCRHSGKEGSFETILMRAIERSIVARLKHTYDEISPSQILKEFNAGIKNLSNNMNKDLGLELGFTGGVLYYNKKERLCKFAGSHCSLVYTDEHEKAHLFEGDSSSIGYRQTETSFDFSEYELRVHEGMQVYMSTQSHLEVDPKRKDNAFLTTINTLKEKSFVYQKNNYIDELSQYTDDDDLMVIGLKL